jgi:tetrahydromethanopterin S-methyltransferase subunit C
MRRDPELPTASLTWIAAGTVAVFCGSWWTSGDWSAAAVVTVVICTPLLALALAMRKSS